MAIEAPHNHSPPLEKELPIAADIHQLARAHGRQVFGAAYRVLGDASLAEDIQQNVFVRLLERPPADVEHWPAYLCAMATRAAVDELRRGQRWHAVARLFGTGWHESNAGPDETLDDSQRARQLRQALGRLPKRQAQCFALRFFDGLSLDDIARTLNVSNNTVSVSINRATSALQRHIAALQASPISRGESS